MFIRRTDLRTTQDGEPIEWDSDEFFQVWQWHTRETMTTLVMRKYSSYSEVAVLSVTQQTGRTMRFSVHFMGNRVSEVRRSVGVMLPDGRFLEVLPEMPIYR